MLSLLSVGVSSQVVKELWVLPLTESGDLNPEMKRGWAEKAQQLSPLKDLDLSAF